MDSHNFYHIPFHGMYNRLRTRHCLSCFRFNAKYLSLSVCSIQLLFFTLHCICQDLQIWFHKYCTVTMRRRLTGRWTLVLLYGCISIGRTCSLLSNLDAPSGIEELAGQFLRLLHSLCLPKVICNCVVLWVSPLRHKIFQNQ